MEYQPIVQATQPPLRLVALVGATTVVLGFDLLGNAVPEALLGFAVRRTDLVDGTAVWLKNPLKFAHQPYAGYQVAGVDSCQAPIQQFHWIDEGAEPDHAYSYTVSTIVGRPDALVERDTATLTLQTAATSSTDLSLVFNRGITATPAYRTQFDTFPPDEQPVALRATAEAYLSRGLRENLLAFLDASAAGDALDVAIYEFQDAAVVTSLLAALDRGVAVRVIAHAKDDHAGQANAPFLAALRDYASAALTIVERRRVRGLGHNKLVVHRAHGTPVRVWCGSTNFSARGFFSQTNVGIVLRDPALAQSYAAYIELLATDPLPRALRASVAALNARAPETNCQVLFSPSNHSGLLDGIAMAIRSAQDVVLLSCPFGLDQVLVDALAALDPHVLVYGILNTNQRGDLAVINRDGRQHSLFVVPSWIEHLNDSLYDASVGRGNQIHVKSVVVDPWGNDPTVVLGSANFSDESMGANDENTLLLRGDRWAAAIVATEFLRVFAHYRFRNHIRELADGYDTIPLAPTGAWTLGEDPAETNWLIPPEAVADTLEDAAVLGVSASNVWLDETANWLTPYCTPAHPKWRERQVFAAVPKRQL